MTAADASVYRQFVLDAVPRLLGALDREPASLTAGSFDRDHWSWKFRDAPVMTLQMAMVPLAALWKDGWHGNPWHGNTRLLEWIELSIRETASRQGRHGGFETIGPNTWDHGVTLAMCWSMASVVRSAGDALSATTRQMVHEVCAKGTAFARRTAQDYAFISNHHALFALAWYRVGEALGDASMARAGDDRITEILKHQSPDGWYLEYGGPDPGYETLGLDYLAQCWLATRKGQLLESMGRSAHFLSHCIHPGGSLGGSYGSRHCSLYYPGGLEHLAASHPEAAAIVEFMRPRLASGNVVTPATVDIENLPTLITSYLEAAIAVEGRTQGLRPAPLPAVSLTGVRRFNSSGITFAGSASYYGITSAAKGGVFRVFDKTTERVVFDDAGFVITSGKQRWSSQLLGCGRAVPSADPATSETTAAFARIKQVQLTPIRFLVLRVLNLTVFRNLTLNAALLRLIIGRLITKPETSDRLTLERTLRFLPDRIEVHDRLRAGRTEDLTSVRRSRSLTAVHMGSANYFLAQDAQSTLSVPTDALETQLRQMGVADQHYAIIFPESGPAILEGLENGRPAS